MFHPYVSGSAAGVLVLVLVALVRSELKEGRIWSSYTVKEGTKHHRFIQRKSRPAAY